MSVNPPKPKQTSRWGSLLSGAVAGLESRLDTILADDNDASAKSRAAELAALEAKAAAAPAAVKEEPGLQVVPDPTPARSLSPMPKPKTNDRLQERLAKAMGSKAASQTGSGASTPPQFASPLTGPESPRTSLGSRPSLDLARPADSSTDLTNLKSDSLLDTSESKAFAPSARSSIDAADTLLSSNLPINPARRSEDGIRANDIGINVEPTVDKPAIVTELHLPPKSAAELEADIAQMRAERIESDRLKQEDMDTVLERIDALQAKLHYLANETVAAAKEANANADRGSSDQAIAEKDEKIALLMEEGVALSKTEMRHLATIRKLNARATEEQRTSTDLRKDMARLKQSESASQTRLLRLEQSEKANIEMSQRLSKTELELATMTSDLASKQALINTLKRRLEESEKKIDKLESGSQATSLVSDTRKIGDLEEQVSNMKIEKKLAEDRSRAETQRAARELEQQRSSAQSTELELKTEITNLEARMEALRVRAEEASSDHTGDAQAKLLRQIETAQTQYTLASENWRSIEGSLNARLTAMEKERDEAVKRESEMRKKARDFGVKCRKLEEELDSGSDRTSSIATELSEQKAMVKKLESSLAMAEKNLEDAHADFEQQRQSLEASFAARIEEERQRRPSTAVSYTTRSKRNTSPNSLYRKGQPGENSNSNSGRKPLVRGQTNDSITSLSAYLDRSANSRRSSAFDPMNGLTSPVLSSVSRKPSILSLRHMQSIPPPMSSPPTQHEMPLTPSILTEPPDEDSSDRQSGSPRGTAADVISAATVHTGPSVQLVERMSSSIRRLEAEKASRADELARVTAQRDEARQQMVSLVREAEDRNVVEEKVAALTRDVQAVTHRYDACLEMLGEREEECLELRGDLADMKRIYRDLVDKMGHE
ncbi:hypothetical protein ANO11243_057810 [Dothideomycetidae sp. 11243]|nr:hypothetical protein ANO11243_057810 [fungal sp. No.11243]